MLLDDPGPHGRVAAAERVRAAVAANGFALLDGAGAAHATVSIDVSSTADGYAIADTLLGAADRAMYAAKRAGRDAVAAAPRTALAAA